MRAGSGDGAAILEAFKPGTAPPDTYSVIGGGGGGGPVCARGRARRERRAPAGCTDPGAGRGRALWGWSGGKSG